MSFLRNAFKDYEENKKGEYEGKLELDIFQDKEEIKYDKEIDKLGIIEGDKESRKKYIEALRRSIILKSPQYRVFINKQFKYIKGDSLVVKFTGKSFNYIELKKQLRMDADKDTIEWIDNFTKKQKISLLQMQTQNNYEK